MPGRPAGASRGSPDRRDRAGRGWRGHAAVPGGRSIRTAPIRPNGPGGAADAAHRVGARQLPWKERPERAGGRCGRKGVSTMRITNPVHQAGVALLRIVVGIIFLWAGLAKTIGAGAEGFSAAGFLKFGTKGELGWPFTPAAEGAVVNPTHGFWVDLAANQTLMPIVNFLVAYGQIAIGVALIIGLFTRFAAAMGALQMAFFFVAAWEFAHGIANQHLTYLIVLLAIAGLGAGRYYGVDNILATRVAPRLRTLFLSGEPTGAPAPA
jgi:thiosulfate dehydrogenase (quinone) large subunit